MNQIHKGMCAGCPYDFGKPATDMAYNLGCLPSVGEIHQMCADDDKAWACHSDPTKVCCGYAAQNKDGIDLPLLVIPGTHASS